MTLSECITDKPVLIVGYTTREHLLLDLDNTTLHKVLGLVRLIIHSYPYVGNALIVLSSMQEKDYPIRISRHGIPRKNFRKACFHVIFDNVIGYNRCVKIIQTMVNLNVLAHVFTRIRSFRGDMTIRISPLVFSDSIKEQPQPLIYMFNKHTDHRNYKVLDYLSLWSCAGALFSTYDHTKNSTYYTAYPCYYRCCEGTIHT